MSKFNYYFVFTRFSVRWRRICKEKYAVVRATNARHRDIFCVDSTARVWFLRPILSRVLRWHTALLLLAVKLQKNDNNG